MEKNNQFGICPYLTSQKLLNGKWSIYLLFLLQDGPLRFNEIRRRMPENLTHTTLSRQLKLLEKEGLVTRTVLSDIPPSVEYNLSGIGVRFGHVLEALGGWGREYIEYLYENRPEEVAAGRSGASDDADS